MKNEKQVKRLQEILRLPVTSFKPVGFDIELYSNNQSIGKIDAGVLNDGFKTEKLDLSGINWGSIYKQYQKQIDGLILEKFGEELVIFPQRNRDLILRNKNKEIQNTIFVAFVGEWIIED